MEFIKFKDEIKNLAKKVVNLSDSLKNEEQTKNAVILPFFKILGYDIFNPSEFVPEFTADVGIKKGEKVDYAVLVNGEPRILVECKSINENLKKHDSQLFRYFGTTSSKFGILTNGRYYNFYTDLDLPNKMDKSPFFDFDITNIKENQIVELAKFQKDCFDEKNIASSAAQLKYLNAMNRLLAENFENPSENFVKFILGEIYDGHKTSTIIERFKPIVMKGFQNFISDKVSAKLNLALENQKQDREENSEIKEEISNNKSFVITTSDELEIYTISKLIISEIIKESRIFYRDNSSYFNILIDDSNRKWVLRYYNKGNHKRIYLRDNRTFDLNTPLDLMRYKQDINDIAKEFI